MQIIVNHINTKHYIVLNNLTKVISLCKRELNSAYTVNITVYLDRVPSVYPSGPLAGSNQFLAPHMKSPRATHSEITPNKC